MIAALALLSAAPALLAAGPADTPVTETRVPTRLPAQSGYAGSSETTISGLVVDKAGVPLANVSAKLYVGGILVAETKTSIDGGFEMAELIDYGRDVTIDMWFVPEASPGLIMENVILKESSAAVGTGLVSKCVKRVPLEPMTDFVVRIVDLMTRIEDLARSGCYR